MAQIRTIDNQRYNVKETVEEIDNLYGNQQAIETGIVRLNWKVEISGYKDGMQIIETRYEPVCFIKQNIMMYY